MAAQDIGRRSSRAPHSDQAQGAPLTLGEGPRLGGDLPLPILTG